MLTEAGKIGRLLLIASVAINQSLAGFKMIGYANSFFYFLPSHAGAGFAARTI